MTEAPQKIQREWVPIRRAPFIFRRGARKGKHGNYYYLSGRTDEWLSRGIEQTGIPLSAGNFPYAASFKLEKIAAASLIRESGTFLLIWFPEHGPYHQHFWPQEIPECHKLAIEFLELQNIPRFSQVHRDLVKEVCDNLVQTWDYMLLQFHRAINAGTCSIVARVGSPLAPTFTELTYDMLHRYKIFDWQHGDAEAKDGSKLYAIHATPGEPSATPLKAPRELEEQLAANQRPQTDTPLERAIKTLSSEIYDRSLIDKSGLPNTMSAESIAKDMFPRFEGRNGLRKPQSEPALAQAIRRMRRAA